jgi:hypothetical protein
VVRVLWESLTLDCEDEHGGVTSDIDIPLGRLYAGDAEPALIVDTTPPDVALPQTVQSRT